MAGNLRPAVGADPGSDRVGRRPAPHDGSTPIRGAGPEVGNRALPVSRPRCGRQASACCLPGELRRISCPRTLWAWTCGPHLRTGASIVRGDDRQDPVLCLVPEGKRGGRREEHDPVQVEHVLSGSEDRRQHPHVIGADRADQPTSPAAPRRSARHPNGGLPPRWTAPRPGRRPHHRTTVPARPATVRDPPAGSSACSRFSPTSESPLRGFPSISVV